jgi:hypothetical protein
VQLASLGWAQVAKLGIVEGVSKGFRFGTSLPGIKPEAVFKGFSNLLLTKLTVPRIPALNFYFAA